MKAALRHYYLQQLGIERWVRRAPHATRTQNTRLMIIGWSLGYSEDQHGLAFAGKAGVLLNKMLASIGLSEQDVHLVDGLKNWLPNNGDPLSEEIQQGGVFLQQQIQQVNPRLILALGERAGQLLLQKPLSLTQMRRTVHQYHDSAVVVSYHPADLLRNPLDKPYAWQDLIWITELLQASTVD